MTYKIKVTFAEGVTREDLARAEQAMGIDGSVTPPGNISHEEIMEGHQLVMFDEWESKEAFEAFISQGGSFLADAGIPMPTMEEL